MANRQYTNYLSNLHNSNLTYHPNSITRLINSIVYSDDNTTNPDLIDFRTKLIEIIINNTKEFGLDFLLDDYFKLRNSLVIIKESIIKDNKDSLIELLSDKNKLEEYISKLDSIYQFNSRYERVKIDDKYERRKKEIKIYDLPRYIKEYEEKVNQVVARISNDYNVYKGNVKSNDIENMLNNLDNDKLLNKITERYDEEFLIFKDCGLDIFEYLYLNYKKEVLELVKNKIRFMFKNKYPKEAIRDLSRYKIIRR